MNKKLQEHGRKLETGSELSTKTKTTATTRTTTTTTTQSKISKVQTTGKTLAINKNSTIGKKNLPKTVGNNSAAINNNKTQEKCITRQQQNRNLNRKNTTNENQKTTKQVGSKVRTPFTNNVTSNIGKPIIPRNPLGKTNSSNNKFVSGIRTPLNNGKSATNYSAKQSGGKIKANITNSHGKSAVTTNRDTLTKVNSRNLHPQEHIKQVKRRVTVTENSKKKPRRDSFINRAVRTVEIPLTDVSSSCSLTSSSLPSSSTDETRGKSLTDYDTSTSSSTHHQTMRKIKKRRKKIRQRVVKLETSSTDSNRSSSLKKLVERKERRDSKETVKAQTILNNTNKNTTKLVCKEPNIYLPAPATSKKLVHILASVKKNPIKKSKKMAAAKRKRTKQTNNKNNLKKKNQNSGTKLNPAPDDTSRRNSQEQLTDLEESVPDIHLDNSGKSLTEKLLTTMTDININTSQSEIEDTVRAAGNIRILSKENVEENLLDTKNSSITQSQENQSEMIELSVSSTFPQTKTNRMKSQNNFDKQTTTQAVKKPTPLVNRNKITQTEKPFKKPADSTKSTHLANRNRGQLQEKVSGVKPSQKQTEVKRTTTSFNRNKISHTVKPVSKQPEMKNNIQLGTKNKTEIVEKLARNAERIVSPELSETGNIVLQPEEESMLSVEKKERLGTPTSRVESNTLQSENDDILPATPVKKQTPLLTASSSSTTKLAETPPPSQKPKRSSTPLVSRSSISNRVQTEQKPSPSQQPKRITTTGNNAAVAGSSSRIPTNQKPPLPPQKPKNTSIPVVGSCKRKPLEQKLSRPPVGKGSFSSLANNIPLSRRKQSVEKSAHQITVRTCTPASAGGNSGKIQPDQKLPEKPENSVGAAIANGMKSEEIPPEKKLPPSRDKHCKTPEKSAGTPLNEGNTIKEEESREKTLVTTETEEEKSLNSSSDADAKTSLELAEKNELADKSNPSDKENLPNFAQGEHQQQKTAATDGENTDDVEKKDAEISLGIGTDDMLELFDKYAIHPPPNRKRQSVKQVRKMLEKIKQGEMAKRKTLLEQCLKNLKELKDETLPSQKRKAKLNIEIAQIILEGRSFCSCKNCKNKTYKLNTSEQYKCDSSKDSMSMNTQANTVDDRSISISTSIPTRHYHFPNLKA